MNTAYRPLAWFLISAATAGMAAAGFAAAQEPPPAAPSSVASPAAPAAEPVAPARAAAAKAAAKSTAQIDAGEPRASTSPAADSASAGTPLAGTAAPGKPGAGRAAKTAGQKGQGGVDRLELNTATVTGDREQPKVMYIVPWKSSDVGNLSGKPMNSLLDEALAPVDRDEFRREVVYFDAVKADRPQNGAAGSSAKQGEK